MIDVVGVEGHVLVEIYERGKLIGIREGKNIWTLAGRSYLARHMSYKLDGAATVPERDDRIAYIGVGVGSSPQVSSVTRIADPAEYVSGEFLAPLIVGPTYPTASSVKYARYFDDAEISMVAGTTINVSEFGLYTDGDPDDDYSTSPGRSTVIGDAAAQEPVAYKTVDPFPKNQDTAFRIEWTIRFV
jgi:hypothetical protein